MSCQSPSPHSRLPWLTKALSPHSRLPWLTKTHHHTIASRALPKPVTTQSPPVTYQSPSPLSRLPCLTKTSRSRVPVRYQSQSPVTTQSPPVPYQSMSHTVASRALPKPITTRLPCAAHPPRNRAVRHGIRAGAEYAWRRRGPERPARIGRHLSAAVSGVSTSLIAADDPAADTAPRHR